MSPEILADALVSEALESAFAPPPPRGRAREARGWEPDLNPTQKLVFDETAENVVGHAEKGSGKSVGFGHTIIRHSYENDNALSLVITPSIRTGAEGIWYDLETLILPQWRDGFGLEYTSSKLDPNTKDRHRWIRNRFGGWSKLLLMSIPHPSMVEDRVKGPAPSLVYVDELTNCNGREYYDFPAAQLGRRRGITGPQQFLASCNPKGPSHWVYQLFFVEKAGDPHFKVYHVPITENLHRLPAGYVERLQRIFKNNPTEWDRLIKGLWVDVPTGDGLFQGFFVPKLHVRGDARQGLVLRPRAGFPVFVGYDLGQVFNSSTFLQMIPTREGKVIWIAFDEVDFLGEKILYRNMARLLIERMRFWRRKLDYSFKFIHIADESAINQWRPGGDGSYDAWDFEQKFNEEARRGGDLDTVKLVGCPKGAGSVEARVRMLQAKLAQEEFAVSALCGNTVNMLTHLESDDQDAGRPKRGKWIHKFDSVTYPMFKMEVTGARRFRPRDLTTPSLISCGSM